MSKPTRRRLLRLTGGAAAVALAGCVGSSAPRTDDPGAASPSPAQDTPTATATAAADGDPDHSHHDGHHHEDVPDEPVASAEVRMITTGGSHHFSPHVAWVETGGTVTFVNESGDHSATAYAPGNDKPRRIPEDGPAFDTGFLTEDGASESVTFDTPGVYDYYCIPHETVGMIGTIIVGEPDPHGQPGLSEPTDLPEATHEKIRGLNETANQALGHTHDESESSESDTQEEDGHHEEEGHHEENGHHETTESGHHEENGHHEG